jgi:membrane protease YdiL (CAAX protease family)
MREDATQSAMEIRGAPRGGRPVSLIEVLVGAGIVIGHNVFHAVPNEVPLLFVLGIASIRLRDGSWRAIGLARPKSWSITFAIAALTAAALLATDQFVTEPLSQLLHLHAAKSAQTSIGLKKDDFTSLLKSLALTWTFAAFGEEIVYRRYLLGRAADLGNRSAFAYWGALFCVSVLFGIGHYYQGPAGFFQAACAGFLIGAAYLLSGRNLWVAVLAHGLFDTVAFAAVYLGLSS